jgi:hypothetical protein
MSQVPSFKRYLVEEAREVFFTFGRMNPPTIGHGKLMNTMSTKAGKNPYKIYLSQSSDPRKNPLSYEQKIKHSRKMYPKHARNIIKDKKLRNVFEVASSLYDQGFNRVTMVVGADRITEFQTLLNKYNGKKGRHGFYNFEKINIVSAGDRDPDAEGVEGMSASKQRENASKNDFTTFSQGVPRTMSNADAKKLFNDVRMGMGLKETKEFKNKVSLESVGEVRERYIEGDLFNEGDRVRTKSGLAGHIHRLGSNYVIVALDEGRISRCWLEDVEKIEEMGYGGQGVLKDLMPGLDAFLDKLTHKKQYKMAVRTFLNLRKKNPNRARQNLTKAAQIHDVDIRTLDKMFRDMVKKGVMPKHLVNYHPTFKEEVYSPQKHEWGTDAATKWAKSMTPGEMQEADDEVSVVRKNIEREKEQDKQKHDRMLDRARLLRTRRKNAETNPRENADKMNGVKYNPKSEVGTSRNPVAKNLNKFNKPATHTDRKKDSKRGYTKHKGKIDG